MNSEIKEDLDWRRRKEAEYALIELARTEIYLSEEITDLTQPNLIDSYVFLSNDRPHPQNPWEIGFLCGIDKLRGNVYFRVEHSERWYYCARIISAELGNKFLELCRLAGPEIKWDYHGYIYDDEQEE